MKKKVVMVESQEFYAGVKIGAHHYAEHFAQNGFEVLWLSPAYSPLHYLNDRETITKRAELNQVKRNRLRDNIYGYAPFSIVPFAKYPLLNSELVGERYLDFCVPPLRQALKSIDFFEIDILWISNLKAYPIKKYFKYKTLVHRIADEKSGFKNHYKTLEVFEERLLKESDIVFATARDLLDKVKKIREDVTYLPNGVNYKDFQRVNYFEPEEFQDFNKQKKCIYVGAIAEWLDIELIEKCLKVFGDVQFFFVGPDHGGLDSIKHYKNLHVLGKRKYQDIPNYIFYSDVTLIPFKVNLLTDAINPVKLYEYLACGRPVVSTGFKEMTFLEGPFTIAQNHDDFITILSSTLTSAYDESELKEFARKNDWGSRFKIILDSLNQA